MKVERVYADLNKWEEVGGQFRVILTTRGTHEDLQKHGIRLEEGLVLDLWMDDGDGAGNPDPLYFQGTIHYDELKDYWVADVNPDEVRHASEQENVRQKAEPALV